jgi:SpoVK/Ycf46/Vps4 family AAA+-type ATPase
MLEVSFYEKNMGKSIQILECGAIFIPKENMQKFSLNLISENFRVVQFKHSLLALNDDAMISFRQNSYGLHDCSITYTNEVSRDKLVEITNKSSDHSKKLVINWFSSKDGSYEEIIDISKRVTKDCLYPYIHNGAQKYIDEFLNAEPSIIILIGEPGTGKTNFIRNMLHQMNKEVYLSYDGNILRKDDIFISFVADKNAGAFVIEDADNLLASRKAGNDVMSKLLNIGDGLISLGKKKLIFSTNLETTNDIDPAITRPGRCFDVLKFRKLTLDEANVVCDEYNLSSLWENKKYTIAEIFNQEKKVIERKFGFV